VDILDKRFVIFSVVLSIIAVTLMPLLFDWIVFQFVVIAAIMEFYTFLIPIDTINYLKSSSHTNLQSVSNTYNDLYTGSISGNRDRVNSNEQRQLETNVTEGV